MHIMTAHQLNIFAQRLKQARQEKGLTQEKLGILSQIDSASASARMNQYEKGKHTPDFLTLSKIAQALDLPIAYFYAESDELANIIKIHHRLTQRQRQALDEFIIKIINE